MIYLISLKYYSAVIKSYGGVTTLQRERWIDYAKAIGIILIVLGHTEFPHSKYLYWFHVPLFFILSGLTFKPKKYSFRNLFQKLVNSLIIPYITFGLLNVTLSNIVHGHNIFESLVRYLFLFIGGQYATGFIGVFWFISVLFFVELLCKLILNKFGRKRVLYALIPLLFLYFLVLKDIALPLGVNLVPLGLFYFFIGHHFRERIAKPQPALILSTFVLGVGFIILNFLDFIDYQFDMKYGITNSPLLDLIIPVTFSLAIIFLSQFFERYHWKLLTDLGKNSLIIMFLHNDIINSIEYFNISSWVVTFPVALLGSYLLAKVIKQTKLRKLFFPTLSASIFDHFIPTKNVSK